MSASRLRSAQALWVSRYHVVLGGVDFGKYLERLSQGLKFMFVDSWVLVMENGAVLLNR